MCTCRGAVIEVCLTAWWRRATQGSDNKAWRIAQGPLSVIFGILLGFVASFACSCTVLWNNKYKRIIMLIVSGDYSYS